MAVAGAASAPSSIGCNDLDRAAVPSRVSRTPRTRTSLESVVASPTATMLQFVTADNSVIGTGPWRTKVVRNQGRSTGGWISALGTCVRVYQQEPPRTRCLTSLWMSGSGGRLQADRRAGLGISSTPPPWLWPRVQDSHPNLSSLSPVVLAASSEQELGSRSHTLEP